MVVVEAPFIEELSRMAIVNILDMKEQATSMTKLKFIRNKEVLKITNKKHKALTFGQTENHRSCRLKSIRCLQNKARGTSKTFRQTLAFQISR